MRHSVETALSSYNAATSTERVQGACRIASGLYTAAGAAGAGAGRGGRATAAALAEVEPGAETAAELPMVLACAGAKRTRSSPVSPAVAAVAAAAEETESSAAEDDGGGGDEMYRVDRLLAMRKRGGVVQWRVRWDGDPQGLQDSWEPEVHHLCVV